ncbi:MAG: hypothetical protein JO250_13520 [Armatimonadetes bacterium]|nr:hypothetical protein [Armatimonadota bacterium]
MNDAESLQSPLCRNLRSKKYFFLEALPMSAADMIDLSNHCWCRCTQQVVGPDGDRARPEVCGPGRPCYESHFA